jgi:hypothetical protein
VGAVDEATIKAYIENQQWGDDDEAFRITGPPSPKPALSRSRLQAASAAIATFSRKRILPAFSP